MKNIKISVLAVSLLLVFGMILGGCGKNPASNPNDSGNGTEIDGPGGISNQPIQNGEIPDIDIPDSELQVVTMFTERDKNADYDESSASKIILEEGNITSDNANVRVSKVGEATVARIEREGIYLISGSISNGKIVIAANDTEKVQLILNGASITSATSAAIQVISADKVFVTTAEGTENTLKNGGSYVLEDASANIDGAVFAKADMTFNGKGALTVDAVAGHGIVCKDDLVFAGGSYTVKAERHALNAKDSLRIADGTFSIESGKDAIHAENIEDLTRGYVYVANGAFTINSAGDGISATNEVLLAGGSFTITTTGTQGDATASARAVKSDTLVTAKGGVYTINSFEDAINAKDVRIENGTFIIKAADDALQADSAIAVFGGIITVSDSSDGFKAVTIDLAGGEITLKARKDGLNAVLDESASETKKTPYVHISRGIHHIDAGNDGIDSKGNFTVSGGAAYISGASDSSKRAVSYSGEAVIKGGTFATTGTVELQDGFGKNGNMALLTLTESGKAGDEISLRDGDTVLVSFKADKDFSTVTVSTYQLTSGTEYKLYIGNKAHKVTAVNS